MDGLESFVGRRRCGATGGQREALCWGFVLGEWLQLEGTVGVCVRGWFSTMMPRGENTTLAGATTTAPAESSEPSTKSSGMQKLDAFLGVSPFNTAPARASSPSLATPHNSSDRELLSRMSPEGWAHVSAAREDKRQPWLPDHQASQCMHRGCHLNFTLSARRHHCRKCGKIFCETHTGYKLMLDETDKTLDRVCNDCFVDHEEWWRRSQSAKFLQTGFLHYVSREALEDRQVHATARMLAPGTVASNAHIAGVEITHGLEPAYIIDVRSRKFEGESIREQKYDFWCVRRHFSDFLYLVRTIKEGIDVSNFKTSVPEGNDPPGLKVSIDLLNNVLSLCLRSQWKNNSTVQMFLCDSPTIRQHIASAEAQAKHVIDRDFPIAILRAEISTVGEHHVNFVVCTYARRTNASTDTDQATKTSPEVDEDDGVYVVAKRRYTYFQILHQQLRLRFAKNKMLLRELPKLPGKKPGLLGSGFSASHVEKKRSNLELYLHELLLIPDVCACPEFHAFLGAHPSMSHFGMGEGMSHAERGGEKGALFSDEDNAYTSSGSTETEPTKTPSSSEDSTGGNGGGPPGQNHSNALIAQMDETAYKNEAAKLDAEDDKKTLTAKFIAELLKRSLEAKLDLSAVQSSMKELEATLARTTTELENEKMLRAAVVEDNRLLRKELDELKKKNEKYPRAQLKQWMTE